MLYTRWLFLAKWNILTTFGCDFHHEFFGPGRSGNSFADLVKKLVHFGPTQVESKIISAYLCKNFLILYQAVIIF